MPRILNNANGKAPAPRPKIRLACSLRQIVADVSRAKSPCQIPAIP
jgi:hypothetical protein